MKVVSVVGARPQFIKAYPVSAALADTHEECLVHTGQHYDYGLSDIFFTELGIPEPAYNLGVGSGTHAKQTAEMMKGLETVLDTESPDTVVVYGDTNSTLAAALVVAKRSTPLVHIEAGLRSWNWQMPEEVNRVVTDHCSDLLFTPSESADALLRQEGITENVYNVGDVMYDAVLGVKDILPERPAVLNESSVNKPYLVATIHRPRNTDNPDRLSAIIEGLGSLPEQVVLPVHPRTQNALQEHGLWDIARTNLEVVDPLGYLEFIGLVTEAACVVTDSGGIQKEAFYLETPCVTVREETEWPETVQSGWNELTAADSSQIHETVTQFEAPSSKPELYGNGTASARITEILESEL